MEARNNVNSAAAHRWIRRGVVGFAGAVGLVTLLSARPGTADAVDRPDVPAVVSDAGPVATPPVDLPEAPLPPVSDVVESVTHLVEPMSDVVAPVTDVVAPVTDVVQPVLPIQDLRPVDIPPVIVPPVVLPPAGVPPVVVPPEVLVPSIELPTVSLPPTVVVVVTLPPTLPRPAATVAAGSIVRLTTSPAPATTVVPAPAPPVAAEPVVIVRRSASIDAPLPDPGGTTPWAMPFAVVGATTPATTGSAGAPSWPSVPSGALPSLLAAGGSVWWLLRSRRGAWSSALLVFRLERPG